jgi:hypothetical protein
LLRVGIDLGVFLAIGYFKRMWFPYSSLRDRLRLAFPLPAVLLTIISLISGCGTTKTQEATEQLVLSSAVDNSIAAIDFRPLTGHRVYFDDRYIKNAKPSSFVNADYVISSMRQQIMAAGCLLQDSADAAEIIIEGRIGTLGADDHRVTYGIPENNVLGVAANLVAPAAGSIPALPEISVARRDAREGAAKVAAFAYHRETRQPLWQSGISKSIATSRSTWVLGVGPFQGGSIRDSSAVARKEGRAGAGFVRNSADVNHRPPVNYSAEMQYERGWPLNGRPIPIPKPPAAVALNLDEHDVIEEELNTAQGGSTGADNGVGSAASTQSSTLQR